METVYYAMSDGTFIETKHNLKKRIRASIFLVAVLIVKTVEESQSNLSQKNSPSILKDGLFIKGIPIHSMISLANQFPISTIESLE